MKMEIEGNTRGVRVDMFGFCIHVGIVLLLDLVALCVAGIASCCRFKYVDLEMLLCYSD